MKIFNILWIIVLFFIISPRVMEAQVFQWAEGMNTTAFNSRSVSTDGYGNSYVTGYFSGTGTFGSTTLTSYGGQDIFFAKYDSEGNILWIKQAGGTASDWAYGITTDASGNSYITGSFYGTATFGTTTITSYGSSDVFIAKYNSEGVCLWVKHSGGTGYASSNGISIDALGNCYLTGSFIGTAIFGTTTLSCSQADIFIAKYDNSGDCIWAKQVGESYEDAGLGICSDANGNIYVTGYFRGTVTFGTTTMTSTSGNNDLFITKYDNAGNCLWAKQAGGGVYGYGVSVDASGNSYITGYFYGPSTFGSSTLTSYGGQDIFFAKYDSEGNILWVKQAGGIGMENGQGITTDASGNSYITGSFYGTATFGTTTITSYGSYDVFIAKYNSEGVCLWAKNAGSTSDDYGNGITISGNGSVYIVGLCWNSATFGSITLFGGFLAKISPNSLNITSPIGGESWQTTTQHNITWNSVDDGNIKIEITTNNGTNWFTLQNSVQASLGNFTFTVPPFPNSSECRIKLTSLSYGNISTGGLFSITSTNVPNLTITSPNTLVKWNVGSTQNISWIKTGDIVNVKLEYTTNNGNNWNTIINSTLASDQSYSWIVPDVPSTKCRVRVSDIANSALNDVSDELFTIANIAISAPIGGEKWRAQTNKNIEWNSTGVSNVNLFYSTNNGTDWLTISNSVTASNGTYSWTVPSVASTNCRIKIEDASDNTLIAISDVFEIWEPIVSAQTPATGQITQGFGTTNITFSAFVLVSSTATVTFYLYESPQQGTLPNGVLVVSGYYWTITSPTISFFNGVISVPLAALMGVTDPSKLVWLKRANAGDPWTNIGGNVSEGNLLSTVAFESFSEFAIGSTDASNPLPVELVLFKGNVLGKEVVLDWATKTEVNNYGFIVERRDLNNEQNATEWKKRGFVKGAGNSNSPKEYSFSDDHLNSGKYQYRLKMIDNDGTFENSSIVEAEIGVPHEYTLSQNYPNPFNPSTKIEYTLPSTGHVLIQVFAVTGQLIKTLVDVPQDAGYYSVDFSPLNISSGMYFYKLSINDISIVKKMVFLK